MEFSKWLEKRVILESRKKKGSIPNQMPEPKSNIIKPKNEPKQRIAKGRQDTTMDHRPKRLRTRGAVKRNELDTY